MSAESLTTLFESESCKAFLLHWLDLRGDDLMPSSRTFLDHPPALLMPYVLMQDVLPEGLMVRFMGTAVVERWQRDLTGHYFGEGLPKDQYDRLYIHGATVATHPCGLRQVGELRSSTGRTLTFEAVLLPLSVDAGRPPRLVVFSHMRNQLQRQEHSDRFSKPGTRWWLDLGAGIPQEPPPG
jgi:hypothetical protein